MDRSDFAECLRNAVVAAWRDFRAHHPDEAPYAVAIIGGQCGSFLHYALATEQGLARVAGAYDRRGYRYQGWEWEEFDNREKLRTWLRWSNPSDGWHGGDFPEGSGVPRMLSTLVEAGAFGGDAEDLEEFCTDVLASLQARPDWQKQLSGKCVVVGFTYGADPRDFLRTATRANPYPLVRRLWAEHWKGEELSRRIEANK